MKKAISILLALVLVSIFSFIAAGTASAASSVDYNSNYDVNVDGKVDLVDVTFMSRQIAGWQVNPPYNNNFDLGDVTALARYIAGWGTLTPMPPVEENFKPGEVLVAIKAEYTASGKIYTVDDFADVGAVSLYVTSSSLSIYKIVLNDKTSSAVMQAISILQKRADIKYAEPNYIVHLVM